MIFYAASCIIENANRKLAEVLPYGQHEKEYRRCWRQQPGSISGIIPAKSIKEMPKSAGSGIIHDLHCLFMMIMGMQNDIMCFTSPC